MLVRTCNLLSTSTVSHLARGGTRPVKALQVEYLGGAAARRREGRRRRSWHAAGHVQLAIKAQVFAAHELRNVENLPVVHPKMFDDLVHRLEPADGIALNVQAPQQVRLSESRENRRRVLHRGAELLQERSGMNHMPFSELA